MKDAKGVERKLEELMGVKMGGNSRDGKWSLRKTNWLGWCVNEGPAVMVKRKGENKVIPVLNVKRIGKLEDLVTNVNYFPENKISVIANQDYPCSFFMQLNIESTI